LKLKHYFYEFVQINPLIVWSGQKDLNHQQLISEKPLTDKAMARAIAPVQERIGIEKWTPHDFRRTFTTQQGEVLKTNLIVIEKLLGHKMPKIMATYNKDEILDDRKVALGKWAEQFKEFA
jgi:integrase